MEIQDALQTLRIPYASKAALDFADASMRAIAWHAISASADLAEERGAYASFDGSLWSRGVLPHDSLALLAQARGGAAFDRTARLDLDGLRDRARRGMRNSNCLAIAPTATISNICGVIQSIEPAFQNLYVKSNMSGEFTVANAALVVDLKALGLWDDVMISDLKYHDGSLGPVARVPRELKAGRRSRSPRSRWHRNAGWAAPGNTKGFAASSRAAYDRSDPPPRNLARSSARSRGAIGSRPETKDRFGHEKTQINVIAGVPIRPPGNRRF